MPSIQFIVTDAGRAALVNAQHNGTNAVTIAQVGVSGTPIVATTATANLPGEVKRIATISGGAVAADTMHVTVRDESADVFTVRSLAFYLSDGTLFGAYGQAGVIVEKSAQSMLLLAIDVIFADIGAVLLQFGDANFINPPATTDTAGVIKIATDAEAAAMATAIKALSPRGMALAFTAANVLARLLTVDGAGSGLDADLLDGQEGSYYTNITARLGYTPLNATTFTGAEILNRVVTVDGSGSGLDADLLDGRHASEFALLTGANFTGAVSLLNGGTLSTLGAGGGCEFAWLGATSRILSYDRVATAYRPLQIAGSTIELAPQTSVSVTGSLGISGALTRAGNTVWDAANDGAGSGMDADLLDGRQAAEFALLTGAGFTGNIGIGVSPASPYGRSIQLAQGPGTSVPMILHQSINTNDERLYILNNLQPPNGAYGGTFTYNKANASGSAYLSFAGTHVFYSAAPGAAGAQATLVQTGRIDAVGNHYAAADFFASGGNLVWHVGNDGAGSGMDADLLDGRQAAEFALLSGAAFTGPVQSAGGLRAFPLANPTAPTDATQIQVGEISQNAAYRLSVGYWLNGAQWSGVINALANNVAAPLNIQPSGGAAVFGGAASIAGALTRAGSTVWDAANDGSGSGMDADLLDGLHASAFAQLAGAGFTGPVQAQTPNAGTSGGFRLLGNATSGFGYLQVTDQSAATQWGYLRFNSAGQMFWSGTLSRNGNQVWDAANDGSGSGMDADLLDGLHASAFALLTDATRAGSNANGYWEKRPNGVIEQWGTLAGTYAEGQIVITFPIQFTDVNSIVISANAVNTAGSDKYDISIQRVSRTVDGCVVFAQYSAAASSINQINGVDWRAVGR